MQSFSRQAMLQRQLPVALDIFTRNGLEGNQLKALAPLISHFQIRVPLIGASSSGKSSLINALIGEPQLLSTARAPETAVPTELHPATERCFVGHASDGSTRIFTEDDVRGNQLSGLQPKGWLEINLPNEQLAKRPHLVLVDLPRWGSGVGAHERVIDDYTSRSLAYCVVVSVEDGTLCQSLRSALQELAGKKDTPIIVIFTKTDGHPTQDISAVSRQVVAEITKLMGREPFSIATTSARKNNVGGFASALDALESQSEQVFESAVVGAYGRELVHAQQQLQFLSDNDSKDAKRIQVDIDALAQQMHALL